MSSMMTTVLPTPAPPKAPTLPPLVKRTNEVDNFDSGLEDVRLSILLDERRCRAMDRILLRKFDRSSLVGGLSTTLKIRPRTASPTGTEIGSRRVDDIHPPLKSLGRAHRDCADPALTKVLLNFEGEFDGTLCSLKLISSASNIFGSSPSSGLNSTSTTGPMTWTIFLCYS